MANYREAIMDALRMGKGAAYKFGNQEADMARWLIPGGASGIPSPQEEAARKLRMQEILSGASLRGGTQLGPPRNPNRTANAPWNKNYVTANAPQAAPPPQRMPVEAQSDWKSLGPLTGSTNPEADEILAAMTRQRMLRAEFERKQRMREALENQLEEQALQERFQRMR
jgi:hypothetical protein